MNDREDDTSTHCHACEPGWIVSVHHECITEMYPTLPLPSICSPCEQDGKVIVQQGLPTGKGGGTLISHQNLMLCPLHTFVSLLYIMFVN